MEYMEFRTIVDIPQQSFTIDACEEMLFVGSCFADNIGRRCSEEKFRTTVNPFGVMYNPVVVTLGTNHVYRLKATGEIVDNCQKRPQNLFTEEVLSVDECYSYLANAVDLLREKNAEVKIIVTVSPIRYRKYGYHGSQLSKATLLLAADRLAGTYPDIVRYFPAYEIVNDELRDYRFYQPDMLHPSEQAVEYIWQRFSETFLSQQAKQFIEEWHPIKQALAHKPFDADSQEYKDFFSKTMLKIEELRKKYPKFANE